MKNAQIFSCKLNIKLWICSEDFFYIVLISFECIKYEISSLYFVRQIFIVKIINNQFHAIQMLPFYIWVSNSIFKWQKVWDSIVVGCISIDLKSISLWMEIQHILSQIWRMRVQKRIWIYIVKWALPWTNNSIFNNVDIPFRCINSKCMSLISKPIL